MSSTMQQNMGLSLRMVIYVIVCIALMTIDHRNETFRGLRSTISSYLINPLQYLVALPGNIAEWGGENLATRKALIRENTDLRDANLLLMAEQQRLASLMQENVRLRELLGASSQLGANIMIAEVVGVDQDYYTQRIVLNKGLADNVYIGQALLDAHGIVGQIIEVNNYASTALLISDPGHALPVQDNRNGVRTIAQGKGDPHELDLLHIPNNTDIQVGDLITSSGLGGRFPANYPVATVASVEILPGEPFAQVSATPMAQLDRCREVLLVWQNKESGR